MTATTVLVWYLVTIGNNRELVYSPPLVSVTECQRLQKIRPAEYSVSTQCVQLQVVKL